MRDDPFAALGLTARSGLSDEDVRAAWRRIAAATHPDREDGGDPARFAAAAAGYVTLRTDFGRGEALADLGDAAAGPARRQGRHRGRRGPVRRGRARRRFVTPGLPDGSVLRGLGGRLGAGAVFAAGAAASVGAGGRGRGLVARAAVAGAASATAFLAAGWSPGTAGVIAGALSWLVSVALRG
jgi:curved DNA-binding protein CbpA